MQDYIYNTTNQLLVILLRLHDHTCKQGSTISMWLTHVITYFIPTCFHGCCKSLPIYIYTYDYVIALKFSCYVSGLHNSSWVNSSLSFDMTYF